MVRLRNRRASYEPQHSMKEILAAEAFVIQRLYAAGFVEHGTVDLYTEYTEGGQAVQLGGRKRYALPGTNLRATVGRITTLFYRVNGEDVTFLAKIPTLHIDKITETIIRLCEA